MNPPHVAQAVAALAGKGLRLRASSASQPRDAEGTQELADGLERLAVRVAHVDAEVRRMLDPFMAQGISPDTRKHSGDEIYSLALQCESQGAEHNVFASVRAGWERGGDELGRRSTGPPCGGRSRCWSSPRRSIRNPSGLGAGWAGC